MSANLSKIQTSLIVCKGTVCHCEFLTLHRWALSCFYGEAIKSWTKDSGVQNRDSSNAAESFWMLTNTHLILVVKLQSSKIYQK